MFCYRLRRNRAVIAGQCRAGTLALRVGASGPLRRGRGRYERVLTPRRPPPRVLGGRLGPWLCRTAGREEGGRADRVRRARRGACGGRGRVHWFAGRRRAGPGHHGGGVHLQDRSRCPGGQAADLVPPRRGRYPLVPAADPGTLRLRLPDADQPGSTQLGPEGPASAGGVPGRAAVGRSGPRSGLAPGGGRLRPRQGIGEHLSRPRRADQRAVVHAVSAPPASWAQANRELAALAPDASLLAARVSPSGSCTPVHQVAASTARPLGSMFKLFVLGALAHQIAWAPHRETLIRQHAAPAITARETGGQATQQPGPER